MHATRTKCVLLRLGENVVCERSSHGHEA